MNRTTISLTPELQEALRSMAAERGISLAALIREMAEEKARTRKRVFRSAGIGASGKGSVARDSADLQLEVPPWRS